MVTVASLGTFSLTWADHHEEEAAETPHRIAELAFMAGCWEGELGGGTILKETHTAPNGGVMLGNSQVVSEGETQFFEFIRIHETEDGVSYQPFPGSKQSVEFPLVEVSDSHVVFENPDHDYPQRVSYRLSESTLTARIEKVDGTKAQTFTLQAVPCGGESHLSPPAPQP
ncbi:MAG: DUF6265 family protein [Acidobacteriota bacterium]